jgi:hypothetical protein
VEEKQIARDAEEKRNGTTAEHFGDEILKVDVEGHALYAVSGLLKAGMNEQYHYDAEEGQQSDLV